MGIARRVPQPELGVYGNQNRVSVGRYYHRLVTGTSGAVDTTNSDPAADSAVTMVKTGSKTGRYTITLPTPHRKLLQVTATVIGSSDAAYGAVSVGLLAFIRNDAVSTAGTFDLQFANASTNFTDAELPNNLSVMIEIVVQN